MPNVRVVLVRPESAANVGACARIVRNTAAASLELVQPGDWRTLESWRSAWGAQEVLEQTRVHDSLERALEGAALVFAFTGRRPEGPSPLDVRDAATEAASLGRDETAALVFGPEASGLSNDEIACCGRAATIPSHRAQPSYNLSHAVAIACYEVFRATRHQVNEPTRRASHDEKERLLGLLASGLRGVRALPPANEAALLTDWRSLVQRMDLTAHDLRMLEHVARKMAALRRT